MRLTGLELGLLFLDLGALPALPFPAGTFINISMSRSVYIYSFYYGILGSKLHIHVRFVLRLETKTNFLVRKNVRTQYCTPSTRQVSAKLDSQKACSHSIAPCPIVAAANGRALSGPTTGVAMGFRPFDWRLVVRCCCCLS